MSTSNLRMLVSRFPKVSLKGLAYLASANFLARAIILLRHYILTSFHSEMILIYGATLDTRILLFFQAIYMLPMFLLGVLVFYGIERESFNLVLYPTLMLVFLILIRYGSEAALLAIHWEDHKFDQMPEVAFALLQDIIFIVLLFLYVYVCLAFTPIKPTPLELIEGGNAAFVSAPPQDTNLLPVPTNSQQQFSPIPIQQQQQQQLLASPQQVLLPPTPPPPIRSTNPVESQGFNYSLKRNVDQKPKETVVVESKPMQVEADQQRQSQPNTLMIVREKESACGSSSGVSGGGGKVIETDLDAVPSTSSTVAAAAAATTTTAAQEANNVEPATSTTTTTAAAATTTAEAAPTTASGPEEPIVTVKLNKSRIAAARKKLAETAQKEPEKPVEPEVDFWGTLNGDSTESTSKSDGFKTTSV